MDGATKQSRGALEIRRTKDIPVLSTRFTLFSFYARSLLSFIRWTGLGWKMQGKAHKSEQRLEGERDIRNVLYTSRNVRWLSFMSRACGTFLTFLFELGTCACKEDVVACGPWSGFSSSDCCEVGGTSPTDRLVVSNSYVCYTASSFASCSHRALLKMWQTQRNDYNTVSEFVIGWKEYKKVCYRRQRT